MCVATQYERNFFSFRKIQYSRLMGKQYDWRIISNTNKGRRPVSSGPGPIVDAGKLNHIWSTADARVGIGQHRNVVAFQCASGQFRICIMIMIPQDSPHALGSVQFTKGFGTGFDKTTIRSSVVTCKDEHVGLCLLGEANYTSHFIKAQDAAVVNIGQLRNPEPFEAFRKIPNEDIRLRY